MTRSRDETSGRWRIPSVWGEEKRVLAGVRALALACGFSESRAEEMASAVAEACLNAAEHGNGMDPARFIRVEYRFADAAARIRVYDDGEGFAENAARPAAGGGDGRGWGLRLMRGLADEVRFFRGEQGHCAELRFWLEREEDRRDGHGRTT